MQLPPGKHYACPGDGRPCEQPGYVCDKATRLCLPPDAGEGEMDAGTDGGELPDAGQDGGPDAGGSDAGAPDAGVMDAGSGEVPEVRGTVPAAPRCGDAGWCWENPVAGHTDLLAVRGSDAGDFWAVGAGGTALNWDGVRWQRVETGTRETLRSVWIAPNGTVWASGTGGTLLQLRNGGWVSHPHPASGVWLNAIDGPADGGVVVVGESATLLARQSDGGWSQQPTDLPDPPPNDPPYDFLDLWAPSQQLAWVTGTRGWMLRWDGGSWSSSQPFPGVDLRAVHGATMDSAFAVGGNGQVYRWDGGDWAPYSQTLLGPFLSGVWASSADQAWVTRAAPDAGVYAASGNALTLVPDDSRQPMHAVWGTDDQNIWIVGGNGAIARLTDKVREFPGGVTRDVNGVWSPGGGQLWAVGTDYVTIRDDAGTYTYRPNEAETVSTGRLNAITGALGTAVAVGENGIFLWNTGTATWRKENLTLAQELFALSQSSTASTWAVGNGGTILVYNAGLWQTGATAATTNINFRAVWTAPAPSADVLIAGLGGVVFRRSPFTGNWTRVNLPATSPVVDLHAIWGPAPDDAWVVGASGAIFHYDGTTTLQALTTPATTTLRAVHGTGPQDVWAAGDRGVVLRWNGAEWRTQTTGSGANFRALWVTATDVWVAGENGAILHLARPPGG